MPQLHADELQVVEFQTARLQTDNWKDEPEQCNTVFNRKFWKTNLNSKAKKTQKIEIIEWKSPNVSRKLNDIVNCSPSMVIPAIAMR